MLNPLSEQSLAARASKPEPIADPVPFRGGDFCYVRCRLTGFDRDLPVCVKGSTEYAILELVTKDGNAVNHTMYAVPSALLSAAAVKKEMGA